MTMWKWIPCCTTHDASKNINQDLTAKSHVIMDRTPTSSTNRRPHASTFGKSTLVSMRSEELRQAIDESEIAISKDTNKKSDEKDLTRQIIKWNRPVVQFSQLEKVGFFDVLYSLREGDIVLFKTNKMLSRIQRALVKSGGFDHVGIILVADDCPDECCSKELKAARRRAKTRAWHTLEADAEGVALYRFTPSCLDAYNGTVCIRHLQCDPACISKSEQEEFVRKLEDFAYEMNGRPYEKRFMEIIRAANILGHNSEEDLSSVFCSELVAAAMKRMQLVSEETMARPSNSYIPGDFASVNDQSTRAIRFRQGISYSTEQIIDSKNLNKKNLQATSQLDQLLGNPDDVKLKEGSTSKLVLLRRSNLQASQAALGDLPETSPAPPLNQNVATTELRTVLLREHTLSRFSTRFAHSDHERTSQPISTTEFGGDETLNRLREALSESAPGETDNELETYFSLHKTHVSEEVALEPLSRHVQMLQCTDDARSVKSTFSLEVLSPDASGNQNSRYQMQVIGPVAESHLDALADRSSDSDAVIDRIIEESLKIYDIQFTEKGSVSQTLPDVGVYIMIWKSLDADAPGVKLTYECTTKLKSDAT